MPVSEGTFRSSARTLGFFTRGELAAHLGITPQAAGRRIENLVLEGLVKTPDDPERRVKRHGVGRPQNVYQWVHQGNSPGKSAPAVNRPKRATPEAETISRFGAQRRSGTGIARKKSYAKPSRPEVRKLIERLEEAGLEVTGGGREHYQARDSSGRLVTTLPVTPRGRGMKKAKGKIERAIRAA